MIQFSSVYSGKNRNCTRMVAFYKAAATVEHLSLRRFGFIFLFFSILFLPIKRIHAQQEGFFILRERKVTEIPFELVNNLIVVPVRLANIVPLHFIVDSGVRTAILTDRIYSDMLAINYDRKLSLKGVGNLIQVDAYVASNVSFLLPNVQAYGQSVLVLEEDYLQLSNQLGKEVQGILGYDLFRQFVVKIDYQKKIMTLYKPEGFRPSRHYTKLPLHIEDSKPYIECELIENEGGEKKTVKLMLDTGASHALLLHQNDSSTRFSLPAETIYGNMGRGLAGDIMGNIGRVHHFELGEELSFQDVLTSFPDDSSYANISDWSPRDGTIGGELLHRFTVIFDYPNNALYLSKNKNYRHPFIFSKTGMVLIAEGRNLTEFKVLEVRENTPASEAGIQAGDVITRINGVRARNIDLNTLNDKFRRRDGKKIRLRIKRGDEELKITFRLRNII